MRVLQYLVVAIILSSCVTVAKIDREFTVTGTTVSDGQITISLSDEVAKNPEKLRFIQDQDMQKHLITRAGNLLAGRKVRRSLKIDIEITGFLSRTHDFMHGQTNINGKVRLSENGKELESFTVKLADKVSGQPETKFLKLGDQLANQIHWYGAKRYPEPKV